ncbi:MAG: M28 family peptidase [Marinilabiliaceae bacterium]|nr:M28 family peptidase [Marinilabiliaceae bacterium]
MGVKVSVNRIFVYLVLSSFIISCNTKTTNNKAVLENKIKVDIPIFNADSAYRYISEQVAFGPRVPNTEAHIKASKYLSNKLKSFGADVIVQEAKVIAFNDEVLNAKNIIGQFRPERNDRILLFAHWDSRPFADNDKDKNRWNEPIDGASDGASGVGVLLEIARQIGASELPFGVDVIFFDAEDYGMPEFSDLPYKSDTWCLGSQYWGKHPHKQDYYARYGILLDMVGVKGATFYKEQFSMQMASHLVDKIWQTAIKTGYGNYFVNDMGGAITDDHIYVNKYMGIPCVDIIQYEANSLTSFGAYWHTHNDTMDIIDKNTLKAVGQTLLEVLYRE